MGFGLSLVTILAGHLVADFYVQTDVVAREKRARRTVLLQHCVLYALCMLVFSAFVFPVESLIPAWLAIVTTHALVDFAKIASENNGFSPFHCFCVDQCVHVGICFAAVCAFHHGQPFFDPLTPVASLMGNENFRQAIVMLVSLLASWRPVSVFVQQLLNRIRGVSENGQECASSVDTEEQRAGRWIGVLERTIVVVLTMYGQFGAIAFVLTAKSIARFNKLSEDKDFAECYLVGTLASSAAAILITLLFQSMVTWG